MEYLKYIEQYLGKSIWKDYIQISNGRDYEVIIHNNIVFRFPKVKGKIYKLQEEKKNIDVLAKYVDIQVPQYTIIDNSYITYPILPGKNLDTVGIGYTDDILKDLMHFLRQLHDISLSEFWYQKKQKSEQEKQETIAFVQNFKSRITAKLKNKIPDIALNNIYTYMDELFFTNKSSQEVFVHGDIQPKNILYDDWQKKISWIIDFTDSRIGSRETDFCDFFEKWEELLKKAIVLYLGEYDDAFFQRVFFLAKRWILFEIDNDDVFNNKFDYILNQLKKYKFL